MVQHIATRTHIMLITTFISLPAATGACRHRCHTVSAPECVSSHHKLSGFSLRIAIIHLSSNDSNIPTAHRSYFFYIFIILILHNTNDEAVVAAAKPKSLTIHPK